LTWVKIVVQNSKWLESMKVNNLVQSIVARYEVVIVTTSTYLEVVWFWWKKVEKGKRSMLKWTSWFPRVHLLILSTLSIFFFLFPFYQTTSPTFPCFFDFIRRRIRFVSCDSDSSVLKIEGKRFFYFILFYFILFIKKI
jgi:hypothetical protein